VQLNLLLNRLIVISSLPSFTVIDIMKSFTGLAEADLRLHDHVRGADSGEFVDKRYASKVRFKSLVRCSCLFAHDFFHNVLARFVSARCTSIGRDRAPSRSRSPQRKTCHAAPAC
jgi:hypothetical protein